MRLVTTATSSIETLIRGLASHRNLGPAQLYEEAVRRDEAELSADGALACKTGLHTGRSAKDKFFVQEAGSEVQIAWGAVNQPMSPEHFSRLSSDVVDYLSQRERFVQDCFAGADSRFRTSVRVVTERAWHSLFARNLFIPATAASLPFFSPEYTIVDAPGFKAAPARHGTRSDVVVAINLSERLVIIAGTAYAGEIKKAMFTILNYVLPERNVLPMHCSANVGDAGDVALFFGLSGTGKTTLSSDERRRLIGDDEHGWSDRGVFNFEGGCYAKLIRLSAEAEPQIFATTRRFGTVLENVVLDPVTRCPDLNDQSLTENTRGAYPMEFIGNHLAEGHAGHPRHVVLLTADAFGVLPPIAHLTVPQAIYHFLSGYTARVAGTESGVKEPSATFSACFGAPFLPRPPAVYAHFLAQRLAAHAPRVWLVNTGWTGGPYGIGQRISIEHTRRLIDAALSGVLDGVPTRRDPVFGLDVPTSCPGVPDSVFSPRDAWSDPAAYDAQAQRLAGMFRANFAAFADDVGEDVKNAGPTT
jgi:phosphoenolpyruvate carboxykinase (ATP)